MLRFRTIPRFVCALVALFLAAQFAGVVSSPLASAHSFANAAEVQMHHQHMHAQNDDGGVDHRPAQRSGGHVDQCCGLHAFFAGIMPPVIAIAVADSVEQQLAANLADTARGVTQGRLDRPPRPVALI